MATIFDKILSGEIPSHEVYADDHVYAFLDINPLATGHTLVIPRQAVATLGELSDASAAALGRALPRVCRAVAAATGCTQYNVLQNNGPRAHQVVMHVHFHVIPKPDEKTAPGGGMGLGVTWPAGTLEDGPALAAKIRACVADDGAT
ncbi:MAG: HIT family protein [Planctomycetota bacterium]